jgi:hypothetical protein
MVIYDKIVEDKYEPQSTNVLWLRPVEGGFSFYRYKNGKWDALKLMNDKGTPSPDDDEPIVPSGGGGKPDPNTVGSEEIIDGSVRLVDLNDEVTDKLDDTYVEDNESLYINGTKPE